MPLNDTAVRKAQPQAKVACNALYTDHLGFIGVLEDAKL